MNRNFRKRIFNTFFEFEGEGFKVLQKFSSESSELRFTYPIDQFQENFFLKCDVIAWFLGRRAIRFEIFAKRFLLVVSKNLFTCSNLCFGSNFCLKIGPHIPSFKQKRFSSIVKNLGSVVKTISLVSTRSYRRRMFFDLFINFFLFGLSALTFWMFGDIFLVGLSKLPFMGLEDTFGVKKFEWKLHNLLVHKRRFLGETSVWNLRVTSTHSKRWKMRVHCEDLFGRVVKTESSVSRRYYRRKMFLTLVIVFFFSGLSEKNSRRRGRNLVGWKKIPSISDFELMAFRLRLQRKVLAEK